jgi:DNA modification methylase
MQVVEADVDALKPWEDNPRINDHAVGPVAESIRTFGFNVPILCDQNMNIIAGHTRLKAAQQLGLEKVPVIVLDMTEKQRRAFSIADNKTAEIADWDFPKLRDLLDELRSEDFDLNSLGFSDTDLRRMLFKRKGQDEDDIPEATEAARVKPGQIYALGEHRLICGNACEKATTELLLQNQQIDMIITSPPRFNNRGMGDWECFESFCADMERCVRALSGHLTESGVVFWTSGNSGMISSNLACLYARLFENSGLEYVDTIAWVKPGIKFTSHRTDHISKNSLYYPAHQWEPILVYKKPGAMRKMLADGQKYMLNFQSDVWEINAVNSPGNEFAHPAVAPIELPYRALQAYSGQGHIIMDPFAGSGTTLIAAEEAGAERKAYLIEINPAYCDLAIERWERYTGRHAELLTEEHEQ